MAFAETFRATWLPHLEIIAEQPIESKRAFAQDVDSYPNILVAIKRNSGTKSTCVRQHAGRTLQELGYVIRVGPALGHTPAFVLEPDEDDVERELLGRWITASEILEGEIVWGGRRVIAMNGGDGRLIDPQNFPLLRARLTRHREVLTGRSIVRSGAPWFRPIDRVRAVDWARPKLLVPELAKVPRLAIDRSGAIPSHGVYAIFAPRDEVEVLYQQLRDGKLAEALKSIAPRVKGDYVRCYRRFLSMVRV